MNTHQSPSILRVKAMALNLLALALTGCSALSEPTALLLLDPCTLPASLPTSSLPYTGSTYHAYGDSITYGFLLPSVKDAYPYLLASDRAFTVSDNGVNGAQACDISPGQIFKYNDNPTLASNMLYTVMIGTNDAARDVAGYAAIFAQCHQAAVSWLAVPAEFKVGATAPGVITKGPGHVDATDHWNSWVTTTPGASISFPVAVTATGVIYIWPRIFDGDTGSFTYSIDGTVIGSTTTATTPVIFTSQGNSNSLSLIRIPSISPGTHTVTMVQTSEKGTMQIVAVGVAPASTAGLPNVLVGDIPYAVNTGSTGCATTATPSLQYMAEIQKTVTLLSGDGLNVRYVPTRAYMFGTSAEMVDMVHPNQRGHIELSKAFGASLK